MSIVTDALADANGRDKNYEKFHLYDSYTGAHTKLRQAIRDDFKSIPVPSKEKADWKKDTNVYYMASGMLGKTRTARGKTLTKKKLGAGSWGTVYLYTLKTAYMEKPYSVAVKATLMTNPKKALGDREKLTWKKNLQEVSVLKSISDFYNNDNSLPIQPLLDTFILVKSGDKREIADSNAPNTYDANKEKILVQITNAGDGIMDVGKYDENRKLESIDEESKKFLYENDPRDFFIALKQLVHGIYLLHSAGIMHHDVKPDNILYLNTVTEAKSYGINGYNMTIPKSNYYCVLFDFGLSEDLNNGGDADYSPIIDYWRLVSFSYGLGSLCKAASGNQITNPKHLECLKQLAKVVFQTATKVEAKIKYGQKQVEVKELEQMPGYEDAILKNKTGKDNPISDLDVIFTPTADSKENLKKVSAKFAQAMDEVINGFLEDAPPVDPPVAQENIPPVYPPVDPPVTPDPLRADLFSDKPKIEKEKNAVRDYIDTLKQEEEQFWKKINTTTVLEQFKQADFKLWEQSNESIKENRTRIRNALESLISGAGQPRRFGQLPEGLPDGWARDLYAAIQALL